MRKSLNFLRQRLIEAKIRGRPRNFLNITKKQFEIYQNVIEGGGGDSIWVLWNPQIWLVETLITHRQFMHIKFSNWWLWSIFHICLCLKHYIWMMSFMNAIQNISPSTTNKDWLILRDFNKVTILDDRLGQEYNDQGPSQFRQTKQSINLNEIKNFRRLLHMV